MILKPKSPPVPRGKDETTRREIKRLLTEGDIAAKEISMAAGISEKEVFGHLEHIRRSCRQNKRRFVISPAVCKDCSFEFRKRTKLTKPGKCPVCHGTAIEPPKFRLE